MVDTTVKGFLAERMLVTDGSIDQISDIYELVYTVLEAGSAVLVPVDTD